MKNWPDLLGLTSEGGRYVVVDRPTPATHAQMDRNPEGVYDCATIRSRNLRPDETTANGAILAMALMTLMNAKRKAADLCEFNRGTPCCQFIDDSTNGPTFYLYEGGYRASLYPAWAWRLPRLQSSVGYVRPLWEIICLEMASKDIVGLQDNAVPATIDRRANGK